jgi:galactofuranose transport system substrate-binding protein
MLVSGRTTLKLASLLAILALVLSACGGAGEEPEATGADASQDEVEAPEEEAPTEPADSEEPEQADSGEQQVQQVAEGEKCTYETYDGGVPHIDLSTDTIGFAQSEREANPFRITETESIKEEAERRGVNLITTNAESDLNKEISDIQAMIDQGAKALIISPLQSEGLEPALEYARERRVPIMTIDRLLTNETPCVEYIGWIGSDFVEQGRRAADAMMRVTGDEGNLAILLGAAGVNVTTDRNKGFLDRLEEAGSNLNIVAQQAADYDRALGQTVTEQLLQSNPEITAIYAHNDEMALGAVAALKAAGYQPGDVAIITIDGTVGAVQGILDGWVSGVIESNPRFGPLAFQALDDFYNGDGVAPVTIISDKEYTPENAEAELPNAY